MPSAAFLRRLRERRDELAKPDPPGELPRTSEDLVDGPVLDVRADLVAFLLYCPRLDREVWFARDDRAAAELIAKLTADAGPDDPTVPVLTFAEVPHLRGKPPELLNAILNVKAEYPGADSRLRS